VQQTLLDLTFIQNFEFMKIFTIYFKHNNVD